MIGIEMNLNIPVHYQMGNPLQQGRWPCDLYIQSYLQFNIVYEKVKRPAPVVGALVQLYRGRNKLIFNEMMRSALYLVGFL
jgi:hypothetical protein